MTNNPRRLLASGTLIGDEVINSANDSIGKIEELMIDVNTGAVGYAVMSFGGILGFGNKFFAVPWQVLRVDEQRKCFVMNIDKEILKKAPGFDKDHWPDFASEQFTSQINAHYGLQHRVF